MLFIIDLNGRNIEVTDLDKAIEQAYSFKDCHHVPPVPSDIVRQVYWRNMYGKLLKLKSEKRYEQFSR